MLIKLSALIITAFVDVIGLLMVIPLLPFSARRFGADGLMIALLVSTFTAAQLLSAPFWGRISDRYGRRPTLILGLGAATIAYVMFAYATSLWLLLLSRVVQGASGGTTAVVQAYVADAIEPHEWAKALGWVSAATNVGVAVGPLLGTFALRQYGAHGPGVMAAALCFLNMLFTWRFLRESRPTSEPVHEARHGGASVSALSTASGRALGSASGGASIGLLRHVLTHGSERAPRLMWMYAVAIGAFQGTMAMLAVFLTDTFGVAPDNVWIVLTYFGLLSVITRAAMLGWAVQRYGETVSTRIGLVALATGLAVVPFASSLGAFAAVIALVPLGASLTFPCVTALLLRGVHRHERGLYMGAQQTLGGVSRVAIPLCVGFAYDRFGHGTAFWLPALFVTGATVLCFRINSQHERDHERDHAGDAVPTS